MEFVFLAPNCSSAIFIRKNKFKKVFKAALKTEADRVVSKSVKIGRDRDQAKSQYAKYSKQIHGEEKNKKIDVSPVAFSNDYLVYSSNLSLCGEMPKVPPSMLNLNATHGQVTVKLSTLMQHAPNFMLAQGQFKIHT